MKEQTEYVDIFIVAEMWREIQDRHDRELDMTISESLSMRLHKLTEEVGEVSEAWIGIRGQNPRKGVHKTYNDLANELCDVMLTAAVALGTFEQTPMIRLHNHLHHIKGRINRQNGNHNG